MQRNRLAEDEWYGVLAEAYIKSIIDFNKDGRAAFSTFAYWRMRYAVMEERRNRSKKISTVLLNDVDHRVEGIYWDDPSSVEVGEILSGLSITKRQQRILSGLLQGISRGQITKALSISKDSYRRDMNAIRQEVLEALGK